MPLPECPERQELHYRRVDCRGYQRRDGLFDIEGHLSDFKTYDYERPDGQIVPHGDPVHDMWIRMTVDETLLVRDVIAVADVAPYALCLEATATLSLVKGLRIGAGWGKAIRQRLGGAVSCTHLAELLGPMATTAYQSLATIRWSKPLPVTEQGRPAKIDSCYAYASDKELVRERWPEHYKPGGT